MIYDYIYIYRENYVRRFLSIEFLLFRIKNNKRIHKSLETQKLKNSKKNNIYFKFLRLSPYYWNKNLMKNLGKFEQSFEELEEIKRRIYIR